MAMPAVPQVDLWTWRLADGDARLLSAEERARAERLALPRDRMRFVAGRSRLREILAGYAGVPPERLEFGYGPHGRPAIEAIDFNLAHADDIAALAVCRAFPVGIDLERLRELDAATARRYLSARELAELGALPAEQRGVAQIRAWTRKEAYLKALGLGLAADPGGVEVSIGAEAELRSGLDGDAARWSLRNLSPAPGVIGALAVRADGAEFAVVERRWRAAAIS